MFFRTPPPPTPTAAVSLAPASTAGSALRLESKSVPMLGTRPSLPISSVDSAGSTPDDSTDYDLAAIVELPRVLRPPHQTPVPYLAMAPRMMKSMKLNTGTVISATLGTYITLPLSAAGFINATIAVSTLSSVTEFASFAALFREFFVTKMVLSYQPQSRYQGPIGFVNTTLTQSSGQPFLVLPLHHGVTPPSTAVACAENPEARHVTTFDPWKFTWKNIEDPKSKVVVSPVTGSAVPVQTWCLTDSTSSSAYTGQVLFLSNATTGSVSSAVVGQILVRYHVLFRYRE